MNEFTKTIIVDADIDPDEEGEYYSTIKAAVQYFIDESIGGTIIVEQGTYSINSIDDTIIVPSNVTIIGRGNAVIEVTSFEGAGDDPNGASAFYAEEAERKAEAICLIGDSAIMESTKQIPAYV